MSDMEHQLTKVLVGQFLEKNGFTDSLASYLRESGVSMTSVKQTEYDDLEDIIKDRVGFNEQAVVQKLKTVSLNSELDPENVTKFTIPSWNHRLAWEEVVSTSEQRSLVIKTKFLTDNLLACATVDKKLIVSDVDHNNVTVDSISQPGIIKYFGPITEKFHYTGTIDGKVNIRNLVDGVNSQSWSFNLPGRAVMAMEMVLLEDGKILCFYCSLNNTINAYVYNLETEETSKVSEYKLLSVCTALQLAFSEDGCPVLFLARQDFTQIMIFKFRNHQIHHVANIALNTAQFSTHSFNVSDMLITSFTPSWHPINSHILQINSTTILAVATSHIPYMRIIVTKVPSLDDYTVEDLSVNSSSIPQRSVLDEYISNNASITETVTTTTKTHYDSILQNIATVVPQDSYSQPILQVSYSLGGLVVGADNGLYAVDLRKSDTWPLKYGKEDRIKSLDIYKDSICVSLASKKLVMWKLK
ncbi:uncharacterized protein KLLA0_B11253g [Kluyveromyces lactis]|uniref:KLLA0B11253p n=1 Tax=Kluyveromyces lactis (strain ATCC 8585 / CBS 2359 / DSM 70799 / NBRC 1267 / NRRL Y-1140 / WM37) TaxID=284590 RepID=Q6CVK9_KLULA|nr:uncharacterized protein KLLA0_B11253g [Kluyveromyces lactis]CAH02423.1 KLLA0B11253p [Kluyveromyces lactis]|eukprot:XP_452030.1 uncharacterized protein KLLA0_B11253g [Kluyveromyces lactis]